MISWLPLLLQSGLVPGAQAVPLEAVGESLVAYAVAVCDAERADLGWLGIAHDVPGGPDAQLDWSGNPCRGQPELRLRVIEGGELIVHVPVRPGLDVWMRTMVAPGRVEPGQDFQPVSGLVKAQELRGHSVGEGTWRSRTSLREGQAVTTGVVTRVPDVERGTDVTLTVQRGNLRIDAPGRLADDGYLGEPVRVVNEATKVVAEGLLIAPDRVRIL